MSESTLPPPAVAQPEPVAPPPEPESRRRLPPGVYRHRWPLGAVVLVLLSFALVRIAGTRPGYDPYGWMIWGYQTLHLSLDLGGAPSWKPLTWLFNVPFALFGHGALWLWMTTAVAVALAGAIFAGRVAHRVCRTLGFDKRPCMAAAIFAGAALLGIQNYMHYVLSVQSDPMIVTLCIAAVDCYLCGRPRWALALGVLAALGRPEAWPFLGLYAILMWRQYPRLRWLIVAELAVVPGLWFGVPWITNGKPLIAGTLALESVRALHGNKILGTLGRFGVLQTPVIELLAVASLALAWWRRSRVLAALALFTIGWMIVEIAFVLHGWPGVPRYMFEPAGMVAVLAGVTIGWILHEGSRLRVSCRPVPAWAAPALVALVVLSLAPVAIARWHTEHKDVFKERKRTALINQLNRTINLAGGARRVLFCGQPVTTVEFVSVFAWYMHQNTGIFGRRPRVAHAQRHASVMFLPRGDGWSVFPWHQHAAQRSAGCGRLRFSLIYSRRHPNGIKTHYRHTAFY